MRNLSNAQRTALEVGRKFLDEMYDVIESGNSEGVDIESKCAEFAGNARNGKAATSALCAYIDTQGMKADAMLIGAANAIHSIVNAPYGSIHTTFDDPEYAAVVADLLVKIIEVEMAAKEAAVWAAEKFEEATE